MVTVLPPLIGYVAAAAIAHEAVTTARPLGSGAAQDCAYSGATRKSFGPVEHDHAGRRKGAVSQRVQSSFFSVISRVNP